MLYVHGCGHFHPENIIDNKFLEELDIDTSDKWILERVGIKTRRTVLPLGYIKETKNRNQAMSDEASIYSNAQTGSFAAIKAIERANINKDDIGMVIAGSCTPQNVCPAESSTIASLLEIEAPCFDISSACSTLVTQINFLSSMQVDKMPEYILLVIPENNTRKVNYADRTQAVLWGDCTTAFVVSTKIKSKFVIRESLVKSSPSSWRKVEFPVSGHFRQDGRTVQTFAIKKSVSLIRKFKLDLPNIEQPKLKFIGHQANLMMLNSVCRISGIEDNNHFYNVDRFGNCGASGSGSVLSENWGNFVCGDKIMVAVVGAGLTWGGALIEVEGN